jgi:hypothetical protein
LELTPSQPTIHQLFKEVYQYRVPRYQRPYAWELSEVDEYWADITRVGEHGHFLGPMVLHNPGGDQFRWVIDGQQRLTTLQMTLALIRDAYIEHGDPARSHGTPSSVAPQALIRHVDYDDQFVLKSGIANRQVLEDFVLRHPGDPHRKDVASRVHRQAVGKQTWARNKRLIAARNRLGENLGKYLDEASPDDTVTRVKALATLEEALVKRVSLIVLDLASVDDAFLLFETLNDRGLRLSAADLLKSHLLSKLESDPDHVGAEIDEAADRWDDMVDRLGGGDITAFLRHYLLMTNRRVSKAEVFPLIKEQVTRDGASAVLSDIVLMGGLYSEIRSPSGDDSVSLSLRDLLGTGVDSHRVVLLPGRRFLGDNLFEDLVKLVEVLSFRWSIVGLNAQVLESTYQSAAELIARSEGTEYDRARASMVSRIPSDLDFATGFARQSLGTQYVAAYALRRIEDEFVPGERAIKGTSQVHLEHIMPRAHGSWWQTKAEGEVYEDVVQRWGNLTLLLDKLNIQVSNGDWETKKFGKKNPDGSVKHPGYDASKINLTNDLVKVPDWTAAMIELRARWLAGLACRVWTRESGPTPASYPTFSTVAADPSVLADVGPLAAPTEEVEYEVDSTPLRRVAEEPGDYSV